MWSEERKEKKKKLSSPDIRIIKNDVVILAGNCGTMAAAARVSTLLHHNLSKRVSECQHRFSPTVKCHPAALLHEGRSHEMATIIQSASLLFFPIILDIWDQLVQTHLGHQRPVHLKNSCSFGYIFSELIAAKPLQRVTGADT